jgi:hypothetical protein
MMRFLLVCILAMTLGAFTTGQPSQAGSVPAATPVSAAQGFTGLDWVGKPMSLVKKAGYRCRRDCDWCRRDCYNSFRVRCWGPYCRENFTVCMRHCWERVCRYC